MFKRWHTIIVIFLLPLLVAACGPSAPQATARPTQTPFSTPLPWISTPMPAGTGDNPLRMAILPAEDLSDDQITEFESLFASSGVAVQVVVAESESDALKLLCSNTTAEHAVVAWLDGIGYVSAYGRLCGQAQLLLSTGDGDTQFGERVELIIRPELGTQQISAAEGRTFCRVGYDDSYSWRIPQLWFAQVDFDIAAIDTLEDVEDYQSIVDGVASDTCDLGAVPGSMVDALDEDIAEAIIVAKTSPVLPYGVLVVPPGLPQQHRDALSQVLVDASGSHQDLMSAFFGDYEIQTVDSDAALFFCLMSLARRTK